MAGRFLLQAFSVLEIFVLLSYYMAVAEKFFQYRDQRDQDKYVLKTNEASPITQPIDAEMQLEKYGYLRCRVKRRRRDVFGNPYTMPLSEGHGMFGLHEAVEEEVRMCSEGEVKTAIKQYQKTYKLPETGNLDQKTIELMSTSRCGNADKEDTEKDNVDDTQTNLENVMQSSEHFKQLSKSSKSNRRPWKRSAKSTLLMKALKKTERNSFIHENRKRYLHNYINQLKSDDPMLYKSRQKRDTSISMKLTNDTESFWDGKKFLKSDIFWRLLETGFSTRIPVEEQRATLNLAFRMWSEVIPVRFEEENSGDIKRVDIQVAFGRGSHQNCERRFDGHGGEIAHSWSGRNVHFDDEEDYKSVESLDKEKDGIYLLRVAVHEIGHILGLDHTAKPYSIMYAIYHQNHSPDKEFELGWDDRKNIQALYGVCKGRFSTVFDWVRKRPDNQFIFNTYFFRDNYYWMYENHANRTRYGDPLYIAREWKGVPNDIDGYLHVWYFSGNAIIDDTYFFKGEHYYKYNSKDDEVYENWPHLISEDFGPKDGETEGVPDNLDSVFFDMRDRNIYFFKGDYVWVYDPKEPEETRGCCVRKRLISEEFPALEGEDPLPSDLDSVYYSYKNQTVYFFKNEDVWQNYLFHPRQKQIRNGIKYIGKWYDRWFDICDVRKMPQSADTLLNT